MKDIQESIKNLKELLKKIEPLPWSGSSSNIPFYVDVKKPRESLSKHDSERPTYWNYHDGIYLLTAAHEVPNLLKYIEELEQKINENYCEHGYIDGCCKRCHNG